MRPFGTEDVVRAEERFCRLAALSNALWGKSAEDLQRQLQGPYPEIPAGFDVVDFRALLRSAEMIAASLEDPRPWLSPLAFRFPDVCVGGRWFKAWEARGEIARRAIEYLENS